MITVIVPSWIVYLLIATTTISIIQAYFQIKITKKEVEDKDSEILEKYIKILDQTVVNLSRRYEDSSYGETLIACPLMFKTINKIRGNYND